MLELNGYKKSFFDSVRNTNKTQQNSSEFEIRGSTCILYVKGVSEKVKSILTRAGIRTAFKPIVTLENVSKIGTLSVHVSAHGDCTVAKGFNQYSAACKNVKGLMFNS